MLGNHTYEPEQIVKMEEAFLQQFHADKDPLLVDSVRYYWDVFETVLIDDNRNHLNDQWNYLKNTDKVRILDDERKFFNDAMVYSFAKGHQLAATFLLSDTKTKQGFDEKFLSDPVADSTFLYQLFYLMKENKEDILDTKIRSANTMLIQYSNEHFLETRDLIKFYINIFVKKGVLVGFNQIRENLLRIQPKYKGLSKIVKIPLNAPFQLTPAFIVSSGMEHPNYEEWNIFWDSTYGFKAGAERVANVQIHQVSYREIKDYAELGARMYQLALSFTQNKFKDEDILYVCEMTFVLPSEKAPRIIERSEYEAIRENMSSLLCNKLHVTGNKLLLLY